MIQIKRWDNGEIIHSGEFQTIRECIEDGVRKGVSFNFASLNFASLYRASLNGANLDGASLDGSNLTGASLYRASLNGANLDGASLDGSNLTGASLYRASLDGASLTGASLTGASLNGASLDGANLTGASLYRASLNGASLNGAKYSIISFVIIEFGELSDKLTIELMRHDAEFCGEDKMSAWANGGDCPYSDMCRDFYFTEKKALWKPGKPKLRGVELWRALANEKNIKISI
jgi:hypothetical protein